MREIIVIAWRNIGRNRRRSVLSAAAIAFAIAVLSFSMSLQRGSYAQMIENTVRSQTGHLQLQNPAYWPDRKLAYHIEVTQAIPDVLNNISQIHAWTPRINTSALVSSKERTFGASIRGIQPDTEIDVSSLAETIRNGRFLTADGEEEAVIGTMLAKNLGVTIGDEIVFIGQAADGSIAAGTLEVVGTFASGVSEIDRSSVVTHIRTVQHTFSLPNAATEIAVLLDADRFRGDAKSTIERRLADFDPSFARVMEWPELLPGVEESMKLDWVSGLVIYTVLVIVVGFGIANTFLMAFLERIHEIGVLLSLGMKPFWIAFLVYAESILLTISGVGAGLVLGIPVVLYFQIYGIHFGEDLGAVMANYGLSAIVYPQLSWYVVSRAVGIVGVITALLAIYPAARAASLKPVEALRHS